MMEKSYFLKNLVSTKTEQISENMMLWARVKPGQNFRESLLREIKEETGLNVRIGKPFFVNEWRPVVDDEQWHIVGTFFECLADTDQVVLSKDHEEFMWIDPKDYKKFNLIENLFSAFENFLER